MTATKSPTSDLIRAIHAGQISDVINALNEGADIDAEDMHGFAGLPLRTASFEGNLAIVRELLARGANENAAASDGPAAPLRLALRKGHQDVVALLQQHGAQMPEGFVAHASPIPATLAAVHSPSPAELTLDDAEVPTFPESIPDSNVIEFSHHDGLPVTDLLDIPSQFGTETNVLSMDLLFHDESEAHDASARPKNTP